MAKPNFQSNQPNKVVARTDTRNTPIPKQGSTPGGRQVTHEQIARKAYEIFASGQGGSEFENWIRAERELRGS